MEIKNDVQDRELIDEGTYNMICVQIVDMGTQKTSFKGKEKMVRKVSLTFEVQDEKDSEGNPFYLYQNYSISLGPKSNLGKAIKAWKGITVEKGKSFNIDSLLGEPCLGTVTHNEAKDGSATYANITTIAAPMKGTKFRKPKAELLGFYMDGKKLDTETFDKLNQYVQGKISESPEFKALVKTRNDDSGKKGSAKKGKR